MEAEIKRINGERKECIMRENRLAVCILSLSLLFTGCHGQAGDAAMASDDTNRQDNTTAIEAPAIVDTPILQNEYRTQLQREYSLRHYGEAMTEIVPQAVVVHWTGASTVESTYHWFYKPNYSDGTLNVASQFLVGRDGTIYRLAPETSLCRHAIGYNWCAIGIENVGGSGDTENLTEAQLEANIRLIRYLHQKYPTIGYVFGHYQQVAARASGLYRENVPGYHSIKADPGQWFMRGLRENLSQEGIVFYPE